MVAGVKEDSEGLGFFSEEALQQDFQTFDIELWIDFFQKLVSGSGMKALIEFGEVVALSQREPQKLFKLLDMVE